MTHSRLGTLLLGYQNFAQLQHLYGRELSRALFAACGTKVFFNAKDRETATEFSGYLGEKDVRLHTRSQDSMRLWDVSLENWLQTVCEQLQYHPFLATPTTDLAKAAKQICERYGYTGRANPV